MTQLIRRVRQLLTLRGAAAPRRGRQMSGLGIVEDGAVLLRDGAVLAAGPAPEVESLEEAKMAEELDAGGCVVMPGFVDSHTHLLFARPRLGDYEMRLIGASYPEIAAEGGGILASVRTVRESSREELSVQGRAAMAAMARHGTTTVEAKSGYGLDRDTEIRALEVARNLAAVPTYLGAHVAPPEMAADAYLEWVCAEMLPEVARRRLARFADVRCEEDAFNLAQARRYLERARECGLGLKIHAEQFGCTGAALLGVELGAVSVDNLECANAETVRGIAASETVATLLPGTAFHLGSRQFAPARALIDGGAAVALATGYNPGTSPTCNVQMAISLACTEMGMSPAEAICAATWNGACALGLSAQTGSIEPGKQADVLVMEVSDYREIPYYFGVNHVRTTIQRGVVLE
jgi:imidazolonepropionase